MHLTQQQTARWTRWAWPASLMLLPWLFWPGIAFAGRVLAGVDLFTYFYPLRDYTASALLAGRLPLWNPYLFLGVPLLANSQAGVFYPLNLLLVGFDAPTATNLSILLHLGLAGLGLYAFARRALGLGRPAAWTAGVVYGLGGFLSAQAEHVNQLAVSAWLPWMLLLFEEAIGGQHTAISDQGAAGGWKGWLRRLPLRRRPLAGLALLAGVAFLAGHTQAWYISMFALGAFAWGGALGQGWGRRKAGWRVALGAGWAALWPRALAWLIAAGGGLALSTLQLLPTLELSQLSIRGGGLSYREVIAFSLKPQLLLRAFLPGYGETVFSEYVAYVGWFGLALAGLGLWRGRGRRAWGVGVGLAGLGLGLAFGGYNPLYYLCYRLIPGFGLFRAPARWLVLYALGAALLAGLGVEQWDADARGRPRTRLKRGDFRVHPIRTAEAQSAQSEEEDVGAQRGLFGFLRALCASAVKFPCRQPTRREVDMAPTPKPLRMRPRPSASPIFWIALAALIAGLALVVSLWRGWLERPAGLTLAGWGGAVAGVLLLGGLRRFLGAGRRPWERVSAKIIRVRPRPAGYLLWPALLALLVELFLAGRSLALATPTSADAFAALRTAPAHLLAAGQRVGSDGRPLEALAEGTTPAGLGDPTAHWGVGAPTFRFLSLSDTRYDPGDLAELRAWWGTRLPARAVANLIDATKQKEVLAPNLPLLYRIAAADGYDGGVLPLKRYVTLQRLLLAPAQILPDGRLREQLTEVPPAEQLALLNIEYVITDKVQDVWLDDVFYDLQFGATLGAGGLSEVEIENPYDFTATAFGLAAQLEDAASLPAGAPVAVLSWRDAAGQSYARTLRAGIELDTSLGAARVQMDAPQRPTDIRLRWVGAAGRLAARGLTLIDERTGANRSLVLSGRGRFRLEHSGDVKIYRNLDNLPRAYWVSGARVVADDLAAIEALRRPDVAARQEVLLAAGEARAPLPGAAGRATLTAYAAERVELVSEAETAGYLVLSDADYPGWQATVDGRPAPIRRANVMFRAVELPAGRHTVVFQYAPAWLWPGAALSLAAGAALLAALFWRGPKREA